MSSFPGAAPHKHDPKIVALAANPVVIIVVDRELQQWVVKRGQNILIPFSNTYDTQLLIFLCQRSA